MSKQKTEKNTQMERPPIIAIMGHIDHGKSTLLDYIRKSNVVDSEAGGITQHISAYEVVHKTDNGDKKITFLDTPGHAAFSGMRERGSSISDIAILIVSAEEGVKAQTKEALESIKKAGVPFIVAINKIDRPNANPEKTKQNLAENDIYVEGYGGSIPSVNISAKTGQGIPELLDMIILVSELEEMLGDENKNASGFVLESNLDKKMGHTVTLIIKDGTLKTGDFVITGNIKAKIKKIEDFKGDTLKEAHFSSPVSVFGFTESPKAGDAFFALKDKKEADKYIKELSAQKKDSKKNENNVLSENCLELPIIIKADTLGTKEAVEKEVEKLSTERVKIKIIQSGIGTITENDIKTAVGATNPIALGFNVSVDRSATDVAERNNITLMTFNIIYKLTEWLEEEIEKRKPIVTVEKIVGRSKILKTFSQNKDKQVVGGQVKEGKIVKGQVVKIIRRDSEIARGKVVELQQQKTGANEVLEGNQFGSMIESKISIAEGDIIESFELVSE